MGTLFYGDLTNSRLVAVNGLDDASTSSVSLDIAASTQDGAVDVAQYTWIDTLSVDPTDGSSLYFTSNRLNSWVVGGYDFTGASGNNFRIIKYACYLC